MCCRQGTISHRRQHFPYSMSELMTWRMSKNQTGEGRNSVCKGPEAEKRVRSLMRPQRFRVAWALREEAGRDRCHQAGADGAQVWGFVPRGGPQKPLKETVPRTQPPASPALNALGQGPITSLQAHQGQRSHSIRGAGALETGLPPALGGEGHSRWGPGGRRRELGREGPPRRVHLCGAVPGRPTRFYEPIGHAPQPQERSVISRVSLSSSPRAKPLPGQGLCLFCRFCIPRTGAAGRLSV